MFHIALFQPEIPPNTGNIIRLAANTGAHLHLVGPLGFELDDTRLRRAGLDYHEFARVRTHGSFSALFDSVRPSRSFAFTTRAERGYADVDYRPGDLFLFGPETRGLPDGVLAEFPAERRLSIPMRQVSRSLNLSNAVAVVVYEAWRQQGFAGSE